MEKEIKTFNLQGWVFTYDAYNKQWRAARRADYRDLFNDVDSPNVLRSSKHETLVDLIIKTNGDKGLITSLLEEDESWEKSIA